MGAEGAIAPHPPTPNIICFLQNKIFILANMIVLVLDLRLFITYRVVWSGNLGIISKYSLLLNTPLPIPRSEEIVLSKKSTRRACVLSSFHYAFIGVCEP